jgi:hypothetical protein
MEYPTLITGGTRLFAPERTDRPEGVTVHEMGHQFWYGIIANDEFEHAWLDEGFNTYSTTRTMGVAFPEVAHVERYFDGFIPVVFPEIAPQPRYVAADKYRGLRSGLKRDPQSMPSYRTGPDAYSINAYDKGALTLRTLEHVLGWPQFQAGMAAYFDAYAFSHPTPQDYFDTMERSSGVDLHAFFEQVWNQSVIFDYGVGEVTSQRVQPVHGWVDGQAGLGFADGGRPDDDEYRSVVHVRRWGEGVFPVSVDFEFEDGSREEVQWNGRERWTRFEFRTPTRLMKVRVDPDDQLALDVDSTNDSWLDRDPAPMAATKWSTKWMVWAQAALESFAFFG